MENQQPASEELETYQKVNSYLENKTDKNDDRFSILPKQRWIVAVVAFLCYYGLTTMLFGEDFWVLSITGRAD